MYQCVRDPHRTTRPTDSDKAGSLRHQYEEKRFYRVTPEAYAAFGGYRGSVRQIGTAADKRSSRESKISM